MDNRTVEQRAVQAVYALNLRSKDLAAVLDAVRDLARENDTIRQQLAAATAKVEALESEIAALLPGVYYMDPPDGGSVTLLEQLQRMAKDAARYRIVLERGRMPIECSVGYYYADGAIYHTPEACIDAAMAAAQDGEVGNA